MTTSIDKGKILPGSRKVKIADIKVGVRRREDMGDVQGLADSLEKYGLIHPVVIDDEWNLVAGGRRMAAATLLGWKEIEVRLTGELSDNELRALELEENIRRKDLTEYEKSRNLVELAEIKAEELKQNSFPSPSDEKVGHRPSKPDSRDKVAQELGVSTGSLTEAHQHVAAIKNHPELKDLPKKEAIKRAKILDNPNKKQEFIEKAKEIAQKAKDKAEELGISVNNPAVAEAIGVPRRTIQEKIILAEAAENDPEVIFKSQRFTS